MWIPSHVGISGNDRADVAAREAIQGDTINVRISVGEFRQIVKLKNKEQWQSNWDLVTNNKLRLIEPSIKPCKCIGDTRRNQVVLIRLRIDHTRLTLSYLFNNIPPPHCESCGESVSVEHILVQYQKFLRPRVVKKTARGPKRD